MSGITTPYDTLIRASLPRVLSQLSRDPDAPTYGCFDRNHWHFKIRDFASMVLQGSALTLALLAREDDGLMPPEQRAALGEWARAACEYWASRQHRDGTFDEYYPNERAVIPTSFSTFAVSRIFTAGGPGTAAPSPAVMNALVKAAWALSTRSEHFALNQEAASLPAMLAVAKLSGDERLQRAAEAKIERFLGLQKKAGWFDERGGIDVGYLSTTLDYLCEAHRLLPRRAALAARVLDAARRTADVLQYFCHPDGTCGGQYGSRNTEYLVPSGFEYLAATHAPSAAVCAWFDERVLKADAASGASSFYAAFDDRYLCHNMLHAAVRARDYYLERVRRGKTEAPLVPVPSLGAHDKHFGEAGLWVAGDWRAQTIVALKKGGVVHGVTADGRFFGDYGYRCLDAKGRLLVSSWQSERWRVEPVENGYRTTGPLCRATFTRITPLTHIALRVLAKVLGPRLIPLLQKRLILHDAPSEATLTRTVTRDGDRLRVEDRLGSPAPLAEVRPAPKYSLRHVASSMYFRREEYALGGARRAPLPIERAGSAYVVRRARVWDVTTGQELAGDG
jgi:hypothetical protein